MQIAEKLESGGPEMTDRAAQIAVERGKMRPKGPSGLSGELVQKLHAEKAKELKNTSNLAKLAQDAARRGS